MSFKMILAVNFTPDRLKQLKLLGMLTKAQVKSVAETEMNKSVGTLLGLSEEEIAEIKSMKTESNQTAVHEQIEEDSSLEPVTKEAIILCGFDNSSVNLLLNSIRRSRLKNVPLKAMLTPSNISWTIQIILQELAKEHEYFHKNK
ncbi:hypothetical protein AB840_13710 [Megasphaera cerevisiae DSM 20462]|uniref:DUF3783 domain-containing protein n=1 Tax=Megasphaera cerevisiae DSM 20462 TaxID=1122219 RepID=A0A0J6WUI9_9FIRM|nr:DUF3783 domain-containing protein [Megasphaera cerevisiae]KMO85437.1 hypothetical protein AB840_13710 [Megasphaera cerevisiae DSM 20462]OKY54129.1 hypothetical protein BSR42_04065 [Megasphaera cerevisiae]SKA19025.1 protein of unknown function [Megasphaera cerevisiae DSM 20462]